MSTRATNSSLTARDPLPALDVARYRGTAWAADPYAATGEEVMYCGPERVAVFVQAALERPREGAGRIDDALRAHEGQAPAVPYPPLTERLTAAYPTRPTPGLPDHLTGLNVRIAQRAP